MIQERKKGGIYRGKILKYVKRTLVSKREYGLIYNIQSLPIKTDRNWGIYIQINLVVHLALGAYQISFLIVFNQKTKTQCLQLREKNGKWCWEFEERREVNILYSRVRDFPFIREWQWNGYRSTLVPLEVCGDEFKMRLVSMSECFYQVKFRYSSPA